MTWKLSLQDSELRSSAIVFILLRLPSANFHPTIPVAQEPITMVHLEEVEDRDLVREQPGPYEEDDDEADYTDTGTYPIASPFPPTTAPYTLQSR